MWRRRSKNKFNARRTQVDGVWFDSLKEARHYSTVLKPLVKAGKIFHLVIHPRYSIVINGVKVGDVVLDFQYHDGKDMIYVDVKGRDTALSRLKRKLVEASYLGMKVTVVK